MRRGDARFNRRAACAGRREPCWRRTPGSLLQRYSRRSMTLSRSRIETMTDPIRFYSKIAAYHELSNFAPFGFEADGVYWPTGRTRLPGPEVSRGGERRISRKDPGCQDTEGSEGPG